MKLVRARDLICANYRANSAPVLGGHAIGFDGKVLHGLQGRMDVDGPFTKVVIIVPTVEQVRCAGLSRSPGSGVHV